MDVHANAADVYRAFLNSDALIAWLPPGDMTGHVLEYDFRVGGRYRIELTYASDAADGTGKSTSRSDISAGRFLVLEAAKRIVQSVEFESAEDSFAGEMILSWSFAPSNDGTRITVTAENVPAGISKADHDAGLKSSLANLARYLVTSTR